MDIITIADLKDLFDYFTPEESTLSFDTTYTDAQLEEMWAEFGNTAIDDKDCIDVPFYWWKAGTNRFDIWHWFDILHSKGVALGLLKIRNDD